MGSKDRIQRLKEHTRSNILQAALKIVKHNGWHALNMRRIAEDIDYTAPVIYEYFNGKDALVGELSANGFRKLAGAIGKAKNGHIAPVKQLEAMWLAYWNFAFTEKELYQAMFGVEVSCSAMKEGFAKTEQIPALFNKVIRELIGDSNATEDMISTKYFTLWSVVHGLIAINLINKGKSEEINQMVLHEAINNTIATITH
ncbi:TetR/AcrR family transcriptional regulator [Mucilaginibacter sp. SMC90]|uniref:TetR/AcrR family transcriptional regulator n=1 Tax=Mucilaginibacter sp. SMC90 TaxID=2929803 RepID=UPI001FB51520|nr:TetR/AcrR family transcriptional regulator [Mucilaginibacter sp. SMC90]UOE47863.1 TetR/AcrR family transcriptional regulator [Mucilaginibacter sp. SMC90]